MRGFLAVMGIAPSGSERADREFARGLAAWKNRFPPENFTSLQSGNFTLHRFSGHGVGCDYNQACIVSAGGNRLAFFTGPRVDLCGAGVLAGSVGWDWAEGAGRTERVADGQDTSVVFQFDAPSGRLRVKSDLLNSTFVYHAAQADRIFFSNSSLCLAEITGAEINPVAAVEFLCQGSLLDGKSLYQGIALLPAAAWVWIPPPWPAE